MIIAGLQYFGVHLAVAGVYTGNSLLLRYDYVREYYSCHLPFLLAGQVKMFLVKQSAQLPWLCRYPLATLVLLPVS